MSGGIQTQNSLVTVNETNEATGDESNAIAESIITPEQPNQTRRDFRDDPEVTEWVKANVCNLLQTARDNFQAIHADWLKINHMIAMEMEADATYKGETQVYLPTFNKALEVRKAHVCKASFPTDSFLDAIALKVETPEETLNREANKAWMKKQIENAKLRSNLKPFVHNVLAFGVGILKGYWEDALVKQKKRKHKAANFTLETLLSNKPKKYCGKAKVKTVNNFTFYAHPLTVGSLDECTLQFEDIQVSKQYIETMIKKDYWRRADVEFAHANNESERNRQDILTQNTKTSQTAISGGAAGELGEYTDMSEVWFSMHLPTQYFDAEEIAEGEHLEPVAMKAIICGTNIIDLQYNPFNHGKPPYLLKQLLKTPDVLITPGYGKMVMSSQFLVNDLVNQVNDNGIYGLNPMLERVTGNLAGHSLAQTVHPGATWDVTEKDSINFIRPDVAHIQHGMPLLQMAISQVNDPIAPPILQGSAGNTGAAGTATGAQLLQSNTKTDIADFNEDLEQEILQPLLNMIYDLGKQFESAEMFLAITGGEKARFAPEMLAMDVSWQWVASSQTINQQLRGQQMGAFLQLVVNPDIIQMLMQKGLQLDIVPILRKMWEDGLGQRAFESLIVKQPMGMPGMPGAPVMPGQPGMPAQPAPVSPEQISPVSQNPNAAAMPPVAPTAGEGEQFRAMRGEAEGISGLLGELGNAKKP